MSMKSKTLIDSVTGVTDKWAKQRKREEREASARLNRRYVMMRSRAISQKEAAGRLLGAAWAKASGDGRYPAAARQIFYAARGPMQAMTGSPPEYSYFSQTLLIDHMVENDLDWDVTFDARGNYAEPHTGRRVPLGTLQVRDYLSEITPDAPPGVPQFQLSTEFPTVGPHHRFGAVLFIEKEGFGPLLEAAQIAKRYDLAIMSTKGMSVVAARKLVEEVCSSADIPLLVLHDFDTSGFTILGTLWESTRRHTFTRGFRVIDLGLRLVDVLAMDLEREEVQFRAKTAFGALGWTLRKYGASEAEIQFLLRDQRRVELNAMTSPQFVQFLEAKLAEHGIAKVIPDADTRHLAVLRAARVTKVQALIDAMAETSDAEVEGDIPEELEVQVREELKRNPEVSWDAALAGIMRRKLGKREI